MTKTQQASIPDEEVGAGMTILFQGTERLISEVEPYSHPTIPEIFAMARTANGWSISLSHGGRTRVWHS